MPFVKGQIGNPEGRPKGAKNKTTLLKEERRAIFDEMVSDMWIETIKKLPPTYLADQFLGKAPDKVEMNVETNEKIDEEALKAAAIAYGEAIMKKKSNE